MGACTYDIQKAQRDLEQKYPLTTVDGVRKVMEDINGLTAQAETSYLFTEMIADLGTAIKVASLSVEERQAIRTRFIDCSSDEDTELVEVVLRKIAEVFREWGYDD